MVTKGEAGPEMKASTSRKAVNSVGGDSPQAKPMRMEILDAAAEIIVHHGYEACTMRAVAAMVHMKAGSLYYHFKSKDEIVEEILNRGIETLFDLVEASIQNVPKDAPFLDKLEAAIGAHLSSLVGKDRTYMHVYEHLPPIIKRRSRKMREKYAQLWRDLFQAGIASGDLDPDLDVKLFVPYFLGGLNRVPEWIHASGSTSEVITDLATNILVRGIFRKQ